MSDEICFPFELVQQDVPFPEGEYSGSVIGPPETSSTIPGVLLGPVVYPPYLYSGGGPGGVPGSPDGMGGNNACTLCPESGDPLLGDPVPMAVSEPSCCWLLFFGLCILALSNLFHGKWGRNNRVTKSKEDN